MKCCVKAVKCVITAVEFGVNIDQFFADEFGVIAVESGVTASKFLLFEFRVFVIKFSAMQLNVL